MINLIEWTKGLEKEFIVAHGIQTAIFMAPDNGKPIAIFLHGINGDHHGMIPLAYLSQRYRPILIDLVGHGETDMPKNGATDLTTLRLWFSKALDIIAKYHGEPSLIVTHSFGCYVVNQNDHIKSVFICPVPNASRFYTFMSRAGDFMFKTNLAIRVYNSFPFAIIRGIKLLHTRTRRTVDLMIFLSQVSRAATLEQRRYQARLSLLSSKRDLFVDIDPDIVIIGLADKVACERSSDQMQRVFPQAVIKSASGGHLAPIENAKEIFDIIGL